jgi:hypothetical protein
MAKAFLDTGGDLKEVAKTMVSSPEARWHNTSISCDRIDACRWRIGRKRWASDDGLTSLSSPRTSGANAAKAPPRSE